MKLHNIEADSKCRGELPKNAMFSKVSKVRFGSDNWCKSKDQYPTEGIALYAQPYWRHGGAIKYMAPASRTTLIFNLSCTYNPIYSSINSFTSVLYSSLACVLWILVSKVVLVHSKRSVSWLPTGKSAKATRKFLAIILFLPAPTLLELLTCPSRSMAIL